MLTEFDKELLNIIQTRLPLEARPFTIVAEQLGVDEAMVIERLSWLKEHGYIRRFGAFFDSTYLGYVSTLVAAKVEIGQMEVVARAINEYVGVTHNYERDGEYNLWFTLLAVNLQEQEKILADIGKLPGVESLLSLPATEKYKVNVEFKL